MGVDGEESLHPCDCTKTCGEVSDVDMDEIPDLLERIHNTHGIEFLDYDISFKGINYKKLFTQKIQHQEFIHKLDEFIEHHNDEIKDQDEQIMSILKYLTEWLVNHILYVDGQIAEFVSKM